MILHENLMLVDIVNEESKVTFKMLDTEVGEVCDVTWQLMKYDTVNKEWIESPEVTERVEGFSQKVFGVPFSKVKDCIGNEYDVYEYDRFNSFWKSNVRFTPEMKNKTYDTIITGIEENPQIGIIVTYDIDGNTYNSKYNYTEWLPKLNQGFFNKTKMLRAKERFKDTFGVDNLDDLKQFIGRKIKVKVKPAGKDGLYGDIMAVL